MPFVWEQEPEAWWVEELRRIAPPNDKLNWLLIHWEPGETWEPVQRWMIREMDPRHDRMSLNEHLEYETHPRSPERGRWIGEGVNRRWKSYGGPSLRQYELFHRYRCRSRRVWICQGPNGGHPFELSQAERAFKQALGLPEADTPAPGALPFSLPDRRTFRRLAELDRLRKWGEALTWDQRGESKTKAGLYVAKDLNEDYRKFGEQMFQFFGEGLKEAIDSVPKGTLREWYDNAPKHDGPAHDQEAIAEKFISASPVSLEKAS